MRKMQNTKDLTALEGKGKENSKYKIFEIIVGKCEKNLRRLNRLKAPATGAFTHDTRTAGNAAAKVIRIRAAKRRF